MCSCTQTRKVFQGGGLLDSCRRRRNRLETCLKKTNKCGQKNTAVCFTAVELEKNVTSYLVRFFFQAEDGIRDAQESRGLGDVYKRQGHNTPGRTQPSHDTVSYVDGLALVLLELEKSGAPLPCNCTLCTAHL